MNEQDRKHNKFIVFQTVGKDGNLKTKTSYYIFAGKILNTYIYTAWQ